MRTDKWINVSERGAEGNPVTCDRQSFAKAALPFRVENMVFLMSGAVQVDIPINESLLHPIAKYKLMDVDLCNKN